MSDLVTASLITGVFALSIVGANAAIARQVSITAAEAAKTLALSAEAVHAAAAATAEIARLNAELVKALTKESTNG